MQNAILTNAQYQGTQIVPGSLISQTVTQMSPAVYTNSYLSASPLTPPVFSDPMSMGLVSSAFANQSEWVTISGNTLTFGYPSLLVWDNEFYQFPQCTVTVSQPETISVLYIGKGTAGESPLESKIGLWNSSQTTGEPDMILDTASSAINGVWMPLLVLQGNESGTQQTILWELDKNSQHSAPILNETALLDEFMVNAKQYLQNQFSSLANDLISFATWNTGFLNGSIFTNYTCANTGCIQWDNWGGEGVVPNQNNLGLNQLTINVMTRHIDLSVLGFTWVNNPSSLANTPEFDSTFQAYPIFTQCRGGAESQFSFIEGWDQLTASDYFYAPSQDLWLYSPLDTHNGNPGNNNTNWRKAVIWSSTDGNLYTHIGADNEHDDGGYAGNNLPYGTSIRLMQGNQPPYTEVKADIITTNPLASPTFQAGWIQ